jgi:hypothetical protein
MAFAEWLAAELAWLVRLLEITPGLTIARYKALYTVTHPPELIGLQ